MYVPNSNAVVEESFTGWANAKTILTIAGNFIVKFDNSGTEFRFHTFTHGISSVAYDRTYYNSHLGYIQGAADALLDGINIKACSCGVKFDSIGLSYVEADSSTGIVYSNTIIEFLVGTSPTCLSVTLSSNILVLF